MPRKHYSHCILLLIASAYWLACSHLDSPDSTALHSTAPNSTAPTNGSEKALNALFERSDQQKMALDPLGALGRGNLDHAAQFGDYITEDYLAAVAQQARQDLQQLQAIERQSLSPQSQVAYDVFRYQTELELRKFTSGAAEILRRLPLDQLFGYHISFPDWSSGQSLVPFNTLADFDNGLQRLDGFVTYLERAQEAMQEGIGSGHTQAAFVTRQVIEQLDDALTRGVEGSPMMQPTKAFPDGIPEAEQERLATSYRSAISTRVLPAFQRLRDFMQQDYLPASRNGAPGLTSLPDGDSLYSFLIEQHTSTQLSAEEIHQLGLAEVSRIRSEMEKIRQEVEFEGSLTEFFEHLRTSLQFEFSTEQEMIDAYHEVWARIEPSLPKLFARQPESELEIRPVPEFLEATAGGAYYYPGTADGSRPGVFYINTSDLPSRSTTNVESLFLHEAVPGHHMQGSLALEDSSLPAFMRFWGNTAYGEGWALYAESLGPELGLFTDPYQRFGHLDLEMLRALRLVVDTGLHAKGWSRERAVQYMLDHSSLSETAVKADVDRYVVWPGQALAYKLGQISIRQLRQRAEATLKESFEAPSFHDQVLNTGSLPLPVLEAKLESWIEGQEH